MTLPSSFRYYTKKDAGFAVIFWSAVIVSGAASVLAGLEDPVAFAVAGTVTVLLGLFMAWIWFGTYYEFRDDFLVSISFPVFLW